MRLPRLAKIVLVEPLERFTLRLTFDDGFVRTVDLKPWLDGPIFEPLRSSEAYFRTVHLDGGTIAWANGADIDPSVLRYDFLKPAGLKQGVGAITIATVPASNPSRRPVKKIQPAKSGTKPRAARGQTLTKKSSG